MPTEEIKGGIFLISIWITIDYSWFFLLIVLGFAVFLKPVQNFIKIQAKIFLTHVFAINGSIFLLILLKLTLAF